MFAAERDSFDSVNTGGNIFDSVASGTANFDSFHCREKQLSGEAILIGGATVPENVNRSATWRDSFDSVASTDDVWGGGGYSRGRKRRPSGSSRPLPSLSVMPGINSVTCKYKKYTINRI